MCSRSPSVLRARVTTAALLAVVVSSCGRFRSTGTSAPARAIDGSTDPAVAMRSLAGTYGSDWADPITFVQWGSSATAMVGLTGRIDCQWNGLNRYNCTWTQAAPRPTWGRAQIWWEYDQLRGHYGAGESITSGGPIRFWPRGAAASNPWVGPAIGATSTGGTSTSTSTTGSGSTSTSSGCSTCGGSSSGCSTCGGGSSGCSTCGGGSSGCSTCGGGSSGCSTCGGTKPSSGVGKKCTYNSECEPDFRCLTTGTGVDKTNRCVASLGTACSSAGDCSRIGNKFDCKNKVCTAR